ncbi:MAG: GNAT family N-acetyltransferase [Erythrobacter sp.]
MTTNSDLVDCIMYVMERAFDPAYGEAWNRRQISDALTMPSTRALVVNSKGQLIESGSAQAAGFVLTRSAADEEELLLIAVDPRHRDNGLAKLLIDFLFVSARSRGITRIFLEMRKGNPALYLYKRVGFYPIGERPEYYRMKDGTKLDAITFARSI